MTSVKINPAAKQQAAFLNYSATQKLAELAQHPIDLTQPNQLTPERLATYHADSCGYRLLYGTERVDDDVLNALNELAKEAKVIEKMHQMQNGEIMNFIEGYPSENRAALHTATRDFFENPNQSPAAKAATQEARQEVEKLRSFIAKVESEKKFNELIAIGMGGSDLGPRATYHALYNLLKPGRRIHFICNVDPDNVAHVFKEANLKETLVVVLSKTGTTLETATNEEFAREKFKAAGLNPAEHFISVTGVGSPLDNKKDYLEVFYMWDWIGGRYSATSMVGGPLLAFAFGFDVYWEFLKGANAMDKAVLNPDIKKNIPLMTALIGVWNRNFLDLPTYAIIAYSQPLFRYVSHVQQVEMESNGKLIDKQGNFVNFNTGPIVWGETGTSSQHSFFQALHQGTTPVPLLMIGYKESQQGDDIEFGGTTSQEKLLANMFAQSLALATGETSDNPNKVFPGNRSSSILLGKQLTPFSVGSLLAFFEHKVVFQGFIWNINSFDQEGVQLGKVLAKKIIDRFAAQRNKTQEKATYPLGDALMKQLQEI